MEWSTEKHKTPLPLAAFGVYVIGGDRGGPYLLQSLNCGLPGRQMILDTHSCRTGMACLSFEWAPSRLFFPSYSLCSVGQCDLAASQTVPVCSWFCTERALSTSWMSPLVQDPRLTSHFYSKTYHPSIPPLLSSPASWHWSVFCLTSIPAFLAWRINKNINKLPQYIKIPVSDSGQTWSTQDHRAHCKIFKYTGKQWCHLDSLKQTSLGIATPQKSESAPNHPALKKIVLVVKHTTTYHHLQMTSLRNSQSECLPAIWLYTGY